jgi:hypothetical protein
MKSQDNVEIVFCNTVVGRGVLNNVVNLSFSAFNFTPSDDGQRVDVDPVIVCKLRMDKVCAKQLRDVMNDLIKLIEESEQDAAMGAKEPVTEGVIKAKTIN